MKKTTKTLWLLCIAVLISISSNAQTYYGAGMDVYTYANTPVILYGSSATTYKWIPSRGLSSDTIAQPTVTIDTTTKYILKYTIPSDTIHYYDTMIVYIVLPPSPNSVASCTNLVNNGDMESGPCTNTISLIPSTWYTPPNSAGTPDYYNTCMGTGAPCGIGYEFAGSQTPAGGNGMAGLIVQANSNAYLEYLEQHLPCALATGQTYSVSFQAHWGSSSSTYSCGNIGALLTATQVVGVPAQYYIAGAPQISGSCNNSSSWQLFSGTLTGNNEQYITIGHFGVNGVCTPTVTNGMNYNYIDNVTITPIKPTVTTSTTSICQGQYLTLTETGSPGASCTWYDPSGTVLGTGASILAAATTTGAYSVSVNPGCSACTVITNTVYISVTPNTSITVTGPSTACLGVPFTYTASQAGASSYTWSPAGTTGNTHTFTVFTTGVQTYTVVSNTCGKTVFTVTVNAVPTLSVVASPTLICAGTTATLTASGTSSTYSWSTSATTASVSVSPTVTATYTVVGTNTLSCSTTKTVTVSVQTNTCTGTQPSYTITSNGTYSPTTGFIAQNMYIGTSTATPTSYTINSINVTIAPSVSITVASGSTLTVNGSWLHACGSCSGSMWQGIVVQNGASLNITNYSIIEDAAQAIYTASSTVAVTAPKVQVSNTILNKNGKHFYADVNNNTYTTSINNTIFTCRSLTSHTISSNNFNAIKTNISAATPLNTSTVNPTTITLAGARSSYGMYFNAVGAFTSTITIGTSTSYSTNTNVFDNLDFGIYANQTNLKAINNRFQNLTGNDRKFHTPIGAGIYGVNDVDGEYTLVVGNTGTVTTTGESNSFLNCTRGVWTDSYRLEWINNNTFDCETTAPSFNTVNLVTGEYGVINTSFGTGVGLQEQLQFANNTCKNYSTGYYHDFLKIKNATSAASYWYNNTISSYTTSASPSNYCTYGLYLETTDGSCVASAPDDAMLVSNNTITNCGLNAVSITNIGSSASTGYLTVKQNTELSVKYNSAATTLQGSPIAAVYLTGCGMVKVANNTNIKTTGLSSYPSTNAHYIQGIYTSQSTNCRVNCNTVNYMGEDFVFEGTCNLAVWAENTMANSRFGLVLRSSGVMGDQGFFGTPYYNTWGKYISTNITDAHTLCDASDPSVPGAESQLYGLVGNCTAATTALPCQNAAINLGNPYTSGVTTFSTTGSSLGLCTAEGGNGRMAYQNSVASDSNSTTDTTTLHAIVNGIENAAPLPVYDAETRWALQYYVSNTDSTVKAATSYTKAKTFALVNTAVAAYDLTTAQTINNNIVPGNLIENNWQQVNRIWLRKATDSTYKYDTSDINALENIAEQCPLKGGSIVYKARAIVNSFYGKVVMYPNACTGNSGGNERTSNIADITSGKNTINLYPNPNNGSMSISYSLKENAALQIMDISGKLVDTYDMPATENTLKIKNDILEPGVYLYRIISNNASLKMGKVIIMK